MPEYAKAELDAMTDTAAAIIAADPLDGPHALYAAKVAELLAIQFPDIPQLPRITLACAHYMSAIGAERIGSATLVHVLGEAGLRLQTEASTRALPHRGRPARRPHGMR